MNAEAGEFQAEEEKNCKMALDGLREKLSPAMELTETEAMVEIRQFLIPTPPQKARKCQQTLES